MNSKKSWSLNWVNTNPFSRKPVCVGKHTNSGVIIAIKMDAGKIHLICPSMLLKNEKFFGD